MIQTLNRLCRSWQLAVPLLFVAAAAHAQSSKPGAAVDTTKYMDKSTASRIAEKLPAAFPAAPDGWTVKSTTNRAEPMTKNPVLYAPSAERTYELADKSAFVRIVVFWVTDAEGAKTIRDYEKQKSLISVTTAGRKVFLYEANTVPPAFRYGLRLGQYIIFGGGQKMDRKTLLTLIAGIKADTLKAAYRGPPGK